LRSRLDTLLRDFDHVIITDAAGAITRVVIGHRRAILAATRPEETPNTTAAGQPGSLSMSPVAGARVTSPFGPRLDPLRGGPEHHEGVDLAAPSGTPVHTPAAGIVVEAGWRAGYGRYVRIRHDGTFETIYGHLDRIADGIAPAARVPMGTVIGYV